MAIAVTAQIAAPIFAAVVCVSIVQLSTFPCGGASDNNDNGMYLTQGTDTDGRLREASKVCPVDFKESAANEALCFTRQAKMEEVRFLKTL